MHRLKVTARHLVSAAGEEVNNPGTETETETVNEATIGTRRGSADELAAALKSGQLKDATIGMDEKPSDFLPGPLQAKPRDEVLLEIAEAASSGQSHTQWMDWQDEFGDAGLSSNIVLPHVSRDRLAGAYLTEKVILSDPDDCIRIARAHTEKEGNFQMLMGDSVISARDNSAWLEQRNHMTQAFMPMSSLAHIFPVSNERAVACADILKRLSQGGTAPINMSEFFLNETQQQLHLALFGESNEDFDEAYNTTFRDSLGGPPKTPAYQHRHQLWDTQQKTAEDAANTAAAEGKDSRANGSAGDDLHAVGIDSTSGVARNADGSLADRKIRGPLSAVLAEKLGGGANELMQHVDGSQGGPAFSQLKKEQQTALNEQTDFGNAFIFAFAGHDTTGHTLTWLVYEMAKNPQYQARLIEVRYAKVQCDSVFGTGVLVLPSILTLLGLSGGGRILVSVW
jgi:cytochrome P450